MKWFGRKRALRQQPDTGATREHVGAGQQPAGAGRQVVDAGRQDPGREQTGRTGAIIAGRDVVNSSTYSVQAESAVVLPPQAFRAIPAKAARGGVSNVASGLFVGRANELGLLDEAFSREGEVVVHAVHGLGGIGKSALAAHWACQRGEQVRWKITADSPAALQAGLAELARTLKPALAGLPGEQQAERVVHWLARNRGWLLVLDNVEDPADIAPLLERVPRGRVLITTRRATGWHHHATTIRLGVLGEGDSVDLFVRVLTHDGPRETDGAGAVCEELGNLALAVEQAAAYCAQTGTVPIRYLEMLAEFPAAMLAAGTTERSDSERTVARIWRLTLDRLADIPLAMDILRILAWYAPDRIPRYLFGPLGTPPEAAGAVGRLLAYNMITDNLDGTVSVHRLVQTLARTPDSDDPHRQPTDINNARDRATHLLSEALPKNVKRSAGWPRYRELSAHIDALTNNHGSRHDTLTTADVLSRTAAFWLSHAGPTTSIRLFRRVLDAHERILGNDHPETLDSCYKLADAYDVMGYRAALPLYERVLVVRERVLGTNHPDTLAVRNDVAFATSDPARAISLVESVVADRERVLGMNHPDTIATRNALASKYLAAGKLEHATKLYENVLGNDHPGAMAVRNDLAFAYRAAGDLEHAINLYESVVADRERVLGMNHPDTIATRNNLAFTYRKAGKLEHAINLFKSVVADRERVLGMNHPDTIAARNTLADSYRAAGKLEHAINLNKTFLADRERVLGKDHPDTIAARNTLADSYRAAGKLEHAINLYESVLDINHPDTRATRNTIIGWAAAVTDRGHTRLPGDPIGAWQDAATVVSAIGPRLADASLVYAPVLSRAYLLAADALDADGQPEAAHEFHQRAANTT